MYAAFYKSTKNGLPGIYNRAVRWWERGKYSHVELVFSDGISGSSSYMDGGVRLKPIEYSADRWDFIELPNYLEANARKWFETHQGEPYDLLGNIRFVFDALPDSKTAWFCSEAFAESIGLQDSWRYGPNLLASVLRSNIQSNLYKVIYTK